MQEPVQDRRGRGNIAEQLSPVLQRPVRGHYRRSCLIPPHDYFKQIFAGTLGQLLDAHVIDYQQIRLEIFGHYILLTGECFIVQKVPYSIEDRAISNSEAALDSLVSNRLNQVTFPSAWRPQEQAVPALLMPVKYH